MVKSRPVTGFGDAVEDGAEKDVIEQRFVLGNIIDPMKGGSDADVRAALAQVTDLDEPLGSRFFGKMHALKVERCEQGVVVVHHDARMQGRGDLVEVIGHICRPSTRLAQVQDDRDSLKDPGGHLRFKVK